MIPEPRYAALVIDFKRFLLEDTAKHKREHLSTRKFEDVLRQLPADLQRKLAQAGVMIMDADDDVDSSMIDML